MTQNHQQCHKHSRAYEKKKKLKQLTQSDVCREEPAHCKVPCVRVELVAPFQQKRKSLPIIHHTRGIPTSRHTPCTSPSGSNPQIGLRRAPSSGPSILRIGARASPRLWERCERNSARENETKNKGERTAKVFWLTQSQKPRHLHQACSHPRTPGHPA